MTDPIVASVENVARVASNARSWARVSFEYFPEREQGKRTFALFECMTCSELLEWGDKWWVCPGCGRELIPEQAVVVIQESEKDLSLLKRLAGGRCLHPNQSGRPRKDTLY